MNELLRIISIAGPLFLATFLSLTTLSKKGKIIAWILCIVISIISIQLYLEEKTWQKRKQYTDVYYQNLIERDELRSSGCTQPYIGDLGNNPLLKHFFNNGNKYKKDNKLEDAINEYKKCLIHPKSTISNKVACKMLIGDCYKSLGKKTEAEKLYKDALDICKRLTDKREMLEYKASIFSSISLINEDKGELEKAQRYLEEALAIDRDTGNRQGEAADLGNIGIVYISKFDLEEAHSYFEKAHAIFREIGDRQNEAISLSNIGKTYRYKCDFSFYKGKCDPEEALRYLEKARVIYKEIGDRQNEALTLANIGIVYRCKFDLKGALRYFEKALAIDRDTGNRQGEATNLHNIGIIYRYKDDPEKALRYLEEALAISKKIGDRKGEALYLANIGLLYFYSKGDPEVALRYLREAHVIYREIGGRQEMASNLYFLGFIYRFKGDLEEAQRYFIEFQGILGDVLK